ncbi:MAG: winged helix-turn-helix domain-containing protein [Cellvibrionaceae bacterium]
MNYTFDNVEIDNQSFVIFKDEHVVHVEPLVFDLIICLIQHAAHPISSDELMNIVWKNKIVSASTISSAIKSARKALGDDGAQQKYIRTIRGRGFQFIADVKSERNHDEKKLKINTRKIKPLRYTLFIDTFHVSENTKSLSAISNSLMVNLNTVLTRVLS